LANELRDLLAMPEVNERIIIEVINKEFPDLSIECSKKIMMLIDSLANNKTSDKVGIVLLPQFRSKL
jgi:hypothetical protein